MEGRGIISIGTAGNKNDRAEESGEKVAFNYFLESYGLRGVPHRIIEKLKTVIIAARNCNSRSHVT